MLETWWYHHHLLFKCLFVYAEGYAGTSVGICASGGQRWTSGIFLNPCVRLWSQGLVDLGLIRWNASVVLSEVEVGAGVDIPGWTVDSLILFFTSCHQGINTLFATIKAVSRPRELNHKY